MTDTPKLMTDERLVEIKAARDGALGRVPFIDIAGYVLELLDHIDALTAQRDEARRELCAAEAAIIEAGGHSALPAGAARVRGWGYLYPEPAAPTLADAVTVDDGERYDCEDCP